MKLEKKQCKACQDQSNSLLSLRFNEKMKNGEKKILLFFIHFVKSLLSYLIFPYTLYLSFPTLHVFVSLGRKKTLVVSVLLMFSSGMSLAWSVNYLMFVILRFCNGMSTVGVFITVYVLGKSIKNREKKGVSEF